MGKGWMIFANFRTNCLVCDRIEKFIGEINGEIGKKRAKMEKASKEKKERDGVFWKFYRCLKLMIKT